MSLPPTVAFNVKIDELSAKSMMSIDGAKPVPHSKRPPATLRFSMSKETFQRNKR